MIKKLSLLTNIIILCASVVVLLGVVAIASILLLPDVRQLEKCFTTTMYEVELCSTSQDYAKLKEISPYVLHAVIAAEDGSFYSHQGFDWHEMEESLNKDLKQGHAARGGSTLTQQLAKNAFLGKEKSVWRKVKEAYLAHGIEQHYTKDFILEKYLNVVEFGEDLYGIKPASLKYFHKSPSQLNPLEAAYMAMLLPNPKVYSKSIRSGKLTPFAHKMVLTILKRMESFGKLSPAAYEMALNQIGNFPWTGLGLDAFQGAPSYSLDAAMPKGGLSSDPNSTDESALESELNKEAAPAPKTHISTEPHTTAEPHSTAEPPTTAEPSKEPEASSPPAPEPTPEEQQPKVEEPTN